MFKERIDKILGTVLSIVVSIIIIVIGFLFNNNIALSKRITDNNKVLSAKVSVVSGQYTNIETQLSQIQTDLSWLKLNR